MPAARGLISGWFPPDGVPAMVSAFIGRVAELADVRALLAEERLVTLTGSGGCGKTRLALESLDGVGADHPDGIVIVDLAPLTQESAVVPLLAKTLGLKDAGAAPLDLVTRFLQSRRVLVLLDTCEHVIAACAELADAVAQRCPSVTVLATSREPLGVDGEVTYRVPSLGVPAEGEQEVEHADAVRLFVERARRVRPNFAVDEANAAGIGSICRRLDGVPLAIELAAARTRMMSVEQIRAGLDDRFRLLTGGARTALPRQRTLQASVDWSYALLAEPERGLFGRLGVFPGSFSLDAAEAVGAGGVVDRLAVLDLLSSLVDRSLVLALDDGRYRLLETIRHFAQARLAEDVHEAESARDALLRFHRAQALRARAGLESPAVFEWLDLIEADHDNLIAALTWAEQTSDFAASGEIAADLGRYWLLRGKLHDGRGFLARALAAGEGGPLARMAVSAAEIALHQWDMPAVEAFAQEGLEAAGITEDPETAARAHVALGWACSWTGRHDRGHEHHARAEALATEHGLAAVHAAALYGLGMVPFARARFPEARGILQTAAAEARACGEVGQLMNNLWNLFLTYWHTGRTSDAESAAEEGLSLAATLGDRDHRAIFTACLAELRSAQGSTAEAEELLAAADELGGISASPLPGLFLLAIRGTHARRNGAFDLAAAALGDAGAVFQALGADLPACLAFAAAAEAACALGDLERAGVFADTARALQPTEPTLAVVPAAEAQIAIARGDRERAEDLLHQALKDAVELEMDPVVLDVLELLGSLAVDAESVAEGARLLGAGSSIRAVRSWTRPAPIERLVGDAMERCRSDPGFGEGENLSLREACAYAQRGRGERKRPSFGWSSLTPTERQVVELVAQGASNAQICERLFISLSTVKTHLRHVFAKIGVSSRLQLAREFTSRFPTNQPFG